MNDMYTSEFVFLGKRNYVHATSLAYGFCDALDFLGYCDVKRIYANYHRLTGKQGCYFLFADNPNKLSVPESVIAMFVAETNGQKHYFGLLESNEPVTTRIEYDEESLVSGCEINELVGSISCVPQNKLFNIIVALTKKMHLTFFSTKGFSQWYVARFDLERNLLGSIQQETHISVKISSMVGDVYTNNAIYINNVIAGSIMFARKREK